MSKSKSNNFEGLVRRNRAVILEALYDAAKWQNDYAAAHTLGPLNQTKELTAVADEARKQSKKYSNLRNKLRKAIKENGNDHEE